VLQERLLNWQHRYPYELVAERDPVQADTDLMIARLRTPLDPLIIGDVGAIINSVGTGGRSHEGAVVAAHVASPRRFPNFPICETRDDFLDAVGKLQSRYQLTADEAGCDPAYEGLRRWDTGLALDFGVHFRQPPFLFHNRRLNTASGEIWTANKRKEP
jgi:hypothetical protein